MRRNINTNENKYYCIIINNRIMVCYENKVQKNKTKYGCYIDEV